MDAAFVITPMGVLTITDTLYDDLDISIMDFIGPYIIGNIKNCPNRCTGYKIFRHAKMLL